MNNIYLPNFSRRRLIAVVGVGAATDTFAPRLLFAQSKKGIVATMIDAAEHAKIETYPVRRNISVLEGSGGNIGVLTGKDGKLLIDSAFTVSKQRIKNTLDNLSSDPFLGDAECSNAARVGFSGVL